MQGNKFELIELDPLYDENGWRGARVAVDGVPAIPFQFHKTAVDQYKTEDELLAYLCRQAQTMIVRYGDARYSRSEDQDNGS